MNIAFFIFSSTNLQDMNPLIYEAIQSGNNCWIAFFDITYKKRQLYHYSLDDISKFLKEKFIKKQSQDNKLKISFFKKNDKIQYEKDYNLFDPDVVFVQEIKPSFVSWYPKVFCKVFHLAWWHEYKHLQENNFIKPDVTCLKRESDKKYYEGYNHVYFGDLRLEQVAFVKNRAVNKNQKVCFIPETYIRKVPEYKDENKKLILFYDELLTFLKSNNIKTIWKKREKGFPEEKWASPLEYIKQKPDVIIEKDLKMPSSIIEESHHADFCIIIDDSFSFFDIININKNTIILSMSKKRKHKIKNHFFEYKKNIIDVNNTAKKDIWKKILDLSKKDRNRIDVNSIGNLSSKNILKYIKENLLQDKN